MDDRAVIFICERVSTLIVPKLIVITSAYLAIGVVAGDPCENDDCQVRTEPKTVASDSNVADWPSNACAAHQENAEQED